MKYRIEMSSGDSEISSLFFQSSIPTVEVALAIACAVDQASLLEKALMAKLSVRSDSRSINHAVIIQAPSHPPERIQLWSKRPRAMDAK